MSSKPFDQVRDETLANIDQLVTEAEMVYRELVLPGWDRQIDMDFRGRYTGT